ncbi:Hint domain-containing protein [Marivita hallyeonensis]|uniref:Hint domain-containing protein n=1 Tax=Marivita hallyeonensis TaxID=996342 RepID=A0A1M5X5D1_9RHOB|nr:Hint domain-containing protein [Marivita hallyeonensis]SHH95039.1 Hint domain-containing protein [Marivita hallyeonensis]
MADLIYIGVLSPMDTDESNNTNENPGAVQGTYDETQMQVVSVSMSDNFDPGITYNDDFNMASDTFTYDLGAGPITSGLDSEARFLAQVVRAATTTPESIEISVYQLQNGATFVRLPDGYKINELTIQSMSADGFDGINTNSSSSSTVVCFVAGTWIETPDGPRKIEEIRVGDLVLTADHGAQPVRWTRRWTVRTEPKTAPVSIAVGALGNGRPFAPLKVSRQHRIFVTSPVARHMFNDSGAFVAAHRLTNLPGVTFDLRAKSVDYVHILCASHELISANGVYAETLLNSDLSRSLVSARTGTDPPDGMARIPVRPLLSARKQKQFVGRIAERAARRATAASNKRIAASLQSQVTALARHPAHTAQRLP